MVVGQAVNDTGAFLGSPSAIGIAGKIEFAMPSGERVSGPGFVVWVQGTRGPQLQRWAERPETKQKGTYWYEANSRVLAIVEVPAEDFAQPLDYLATKYPAPSQIKASYRERRLECDP